MAPLSVAITEGASATSSCLYIVRINTGASAQHPQREAALQLGGSVASPPSRWAPTRILKCSYHLCTSHGSRGNTQNFPIQQHGHFLNTPPAYSNPFVANEPGMTGRATPEQVHTNARRVPSFETSGAVSQLRSRSSDWRVGGPAPTSTFPTSSSPVLGGPTHRPSSAASGATSSRLLNERLPKSHETSGPGEATLFPFSSSPPHHPTRTDIIDDRPEIHAPQPSRLKPWKDILATRSDMLGLDKPPLRSPQRPPVPRKDSPHQGA